MSNGSVRRWRKVLYEDSQGYKDNFTPNESFLAAIEKNKNLRLYSLAECLAGAAEVGKEVCSVLVFWRCHQFLLSHTLFPLTVLCIIAVILLLLGICRQVVQGPSVLPGLPTILLFSVIGFALSPILYKLTDSISTDTIHTMAGLGLFLHLLTQDYGLPAPVVSSSISLNSAIFSAVCLASRFDDHLAAFSLLCLVVLLFLLLPLARPLVPQPILTSSLYIAITTLCLSHSSLSVLSLLFLLLLLQLLCPLLFHSLQSAKRTIHGPWDEAVLT